MNKEEQLANYYRETKNSAEEQRRVIDYDMRNVLRELEKDQSTEGNLKVIRYKSEILAAEAAYEDRIAELESIKLDLYPLLIEIKAHRNDPFIVKLEENYSFDIFLDEEKKIVVMPISQHIS